MLPSQISDEREDVTYSELGLLHPPRSAQLVAFGWLPCLLDTRFLVNFWNLVLLIIQRKNHLRNQKGVLSCFVLSSFLKVAFPVGSYLLIPLSQDWPFAYDI